MKKRWMTFFVVPFLILTACGGVQTGEVQTEKKSINVQDEKQLDVSIRFGVGDITIKGGTPAAFDVDFKYNVEKLKPIIDYNVSEKTGKLSIYQSNMNVPQGNMKGLEYLGQIILNESIPTKLYVKTGAGANVLDLRNIQLEKADIISGVGETTIDLSGNYKKPFDVNIEAGVGNVKLIVPTSIGAKIVVNSGIGEVNAYGLTAESKDIFVNDAYNKEKSNININVKVGVGNLEIVSGETK
ncbi:toast rack family protein [Calidifontibacillus erzurumensis]|uniref:DUF2154 domain-containing protein n=1 Tax=Calidifontibacillus erzurumensis TaxID=2741433 RepID=A0A8J8GAN3_9BACI|nr:toast rack family protein [Calidifontibacillus erzurumensis]NSL50207.1 hypothetical protein [Calidifontibacillus erzurumensis]